MKPILNSVVLCLLLVIGGCGDEEDNRPVYTIQPLELNWQETYVAQADSVASDVPVTSTLDSTAYRIRLGRFPEYLELFPIRSFKRLDTVTWEVTIKQDGRLPYTDTVMMDMDALVELPGYFYDAAADRLYQCDRSLITRRGPMSSVFPRTLAIACDGRTAQAVADSASAAVDVLDTLLISEVHLPFEQ